MKKLYFLVAAILFMLTARGQQNDNALFIHPADALPVRQWVAHPQFGTGPANNHVVHKTTAGGSSYSDWYDLWDEMFDTTSLSLTHSYQFQYDVYPDSNLLDTSGYYPPYYVFTHGMGMSFDPTDSAYYYHAYNPAYQVSAPMPFTLPYTLDSFWVPGMYVRYDTTSTIVDSLVVDFLVTQNGGSPPDSGAYALVSTTPDTIYRDCTADETPRFATPRYFRATDDCIDPVLTTTTHMRFAFPLTIADAFYYKKIKFALAPAITVKPGKYLAAYVYFKNQVSYPLVTGANHANYYQLYAGEPTGLDVWYPQSAHNTSTGYPGSHQDGLIATSQIRYSDAGFTYNGHNILLPSYAYAHAGANPSSGFDVPQMAFHINWTVPDTALAAGNIQGDAEVNVFPNPCTNILNVQFKPWYGENVRVKLVNMIGQVVAARDMANTNEGDAVFDVSKLPAGIYTCILQGGSGRRTAKIIVAH